MTFINVGRNLGFSKSKDLLGLEFLNQNIPSKKNHKYKGTKESIWRLTKKIIML